MLLDDAASFRKHEAEKSRIGGYDRKQKWRAQDSDSNDDLDSQELLAWELEQEKWDERSGVGTILEDPHWQRAMGISRQPSASSYSEEERQGSVSSGRESPFTLQSQARSPAPSLSQSSKHYNLHPASASQPFFVDDEIEMNYAGKPDHAKSIKNWSNSYSPPSPLPGHAPVQHRSSSPSASRSIQYRPSSPSPALTSTFQRPPSPSPSMRHDPFRPSSPSTRSVPHRVSPHVPSLRPSSPSPSVRSVPYRSSSPNPSGRTTSTTNTFYQSQDQVYASSGSLSETSKTVSTTIYQAPPPVRPSSSTSGMYRHSNASPPPVRPSSSMSGRYQHFNTSQQNQFGSSPVEREQERRLPLSGSWNSYNPHSKISEADRLEAEFARLESAGRDKKNPFNVLNKNPGRDEKKIISVVSLEESNNDHIIHLEDKVLDEKEVKRTMDLKPNVKSNNGESLSNSKAYGIKELEAEYEEAVKRKQALLRNCSMDSDEGDDILGDAFLYSSEESSCDDRQALPKQKPVAPTPKTSLQQKLEKFERRGQNDDPSDVSKYPRLQQIRQRRRARLDALQNIRHERAEIWDTLEANWEQMERGITKPLQEQDNSSDSKKKRSLDPEENGTGRAETVTSSPRSQLKSLPNEKRAASQAPKPERSNLRPSVHAEASPVNGITQPNGPKLERAIDFANPESTMYEFVPRKPYSDNTDNNDAASFGEKGEETTNQEDTSLRGEDPPPTFGEFLTQSMSNLLKAVGSGEEQPGLAEITSETQDDSIQRIASSPTEEGQQDDTSTAMGDYTDDEHEQPFVNPRGGFSRRRRPKRYNMSTRPKPVGTEACNGGCINPWKRWNCADEEAQTPEHIHPLPTKSTDFHDESNRRYTGNNHDDHHVEPSYSDDKDVPVCVNPLANAKMGLPDSFKRPWEGGKKRAVVDGFFGLVDDLLIDKILHIVDEKVVDDMASRFGFA